jgi:hypothetical protein
MYELQKASVDFGYRTEWLVEQNTRVVLEMQGKDASLEISKRNFFCLVGMCLKKCWVSPC